MKNLSFILIFFFFMFLSEILFSESFSKTLPDSDDQFEKRFKIWIQNYEASFRDEISALQNELRAVASQASQCDDVKESMRSAENDRTVVHWLKESVAELRREMAEISTTASQTSRDLEVASQSLKELRDVVRSEVDAMRRDVQKIESRQKFQNFQNSNSTTMMMESVNNFEVIFFL